MSAAVDAALALEPWQLPEGDLGALVVGLAREQSRLAAAQARFLAEAQERRVEMSTGFLATSSWLAAGTRCRVRDAGPAVALAVAMTGPGAPLGPTGAALAAGELSAEHAGVVHRVMTKVSAV